MIHKIKNKWKEFVDNLKQKYSVSDYNKISLDTPVSDSSINFCSNCGQKIDSNSKFCPNCGSPISTEKPNNKEEHSKISTFSRLFKLYIRNLKSSKQTRIISAVIVFVLCVGIFSIGSLSKDERNIVAGMESLKSELKSPDSLNVYGAIKITSKKDKSSLYYLVSYGATNSYGAEVTDTALIQDDQYICSESDTEDEPLEYLEVRALLQSIETDLTINGTANSRWNIEEISTDKINKHFD